MTERWFDDSSCYLKVLAVFCKVAADGAAAARSYQLNPDGAIVGLTFTSTTPFQVQNTFWQITGRFLTTGRRFLKFNISGIDSGSAHHITSFAFSTYEVTDFSNLEEYLRNVRNAKLIWEYGQDAPYGLHVHLNGTDDRRFYPEPPSEPITPESLLPILQDAIGALAEDLQDPEGFWNTKVRA